MFPSVGLEFFVKYSATSLFYGASHGGLQKRHLSVHLGYGASGSPPKIPGNSVLVFEVELVKINRKEEL